MGVIDQMLGGAGLPFGGDAEEGDTTCKISRERFDVTYTITSESHDVAYAISIEEADLDALDALIEVERAAPVLGEGDGADGDGANGNGADGDSEDSDTAGGDSPADSGVDGALEGVLEAAMGEEGIDAAAVTDRFARPRRTVESLLEAWRDLLAREEGDPAAPGVGYVPVGLESEIIAYVAHCRDRSDREDDPFELPAEFDRVAALIVRLRRATDRAANRVVVNRRHLPEIDSTE